MFWKDGRGLDSHGFLVRIFRHLRVRGGRPAPTVLDEGVGDRPQGFLAAAAVLSRSGCFEVAEELTKALQIFAGLLPLKGTSNYDLFSAL